MNLRMLEWPAVARSALRGQREDKRRGHYEAPSAISGELNENVVRW
jgi:hypothetical protein